MLDFQSCKIRLTVGFELEIQLVIHINDLVISEWPFVLLQKVRMVKNLFRSFDCL